MLFQLLYFAVSFGFLIIAMTVHEFSHGWVAYKLGDNTAKINGRLTLNPLAHIDPFNTILLPLVIFMASNGRFIFGAAKPVPVNFSALRNPKKDIIWVGLSGPLSNFIFAFLLSLLWRIVPPVPLINLIFENLIVINVVLGVFNLVPIPPLDGSRVVMGLLPNRLAYQYAQIEPFGFIIIIVLFYFGAFNFIISTVVNFVLRLLLGTFV